MFDFVSDVFTIYPTVVDYYADTEGSILPMSNFIALNDDGSAIRPLAFTRPASLMM